MPVIDFSKKDFEGLVGRKFSEKELGEAMLYAKAELGSINRDEGNAEVSDSNRPDLWSIEGIARAIKPHYTKQRGIPEYKAKPSGLKVVIEQSVKKARPFTVGAVVKNVKVGEQMLVQMIQLQEKVAGTFGRKRKEAAIGIYDFDKIHGNIRYYGAEPKKTKFIPLEFADEMDLDEILKTHPKGIEYGKLLEGQKLYPIFEDSEGHILSMPPVINSNYSGKVSGGTKNLFVEVSGFSEETISTALSVIVCALADRGGKIETVKIVDGRKSKATPDLSPKKAVMDPDYARKVSGLKLKDREIIGLLERHNWNAKKKGKMLELSYPCYRQDVLHQVDAVEDMVISYGYNSIEPEPINVYTRGGELEETKELDRAREACIGIGLQEILTYTLTSIEKQGRKMLLDKEEFAEIENYQSTSYQVFRKSLVPEALEFLAKNKSVELPQRVFEAGRAVRVDGSRETGVVESDLLCIALTDFELNFNQAKSILQELSKLLGRKLSLSDSDRPWLIEGRAAEIIEGGKPIGVIGEIHPKALENFGLQTPVVVIEMSINSGV